MPAFKQEAALHFPWAVVTGDAPLVAAAVHNGHAVRDELKPYLGLSDAERLREEDPFTGGWTGVAPNQIIGNRSRFEVDLNRPPDKAVYLKPEDAWGLDVWKEPLPDDLVARSLAQHTAFYHEVGELLHDLARRHGKFVVFDLHSYNHRREGADGPPADPDANPEVNIGTRTLDRERWAPVVERFMTDLRSFDFSGRQLDVRENVKFQGGYFPQWVHETFPESGCALAIEFKKIFMDEWTGEPDRRQVEVIHAALESTVPGVLEVLQQVR